MSGKASYLALVDTNHVYKTTQYQIVGGSSLKNIGDWVLDSILLREAGIIQYLLRPVEYASDCLEIIFNGHYGQACFLLHSEYQ